MKNSMNRLKPTAKQMAFLLILPLLAFTISCNDDDGDDGMDPNAPTQSILELAQASDDLSNLEAALVKFDDLVAALGEESVNYTVFAPTNDAFATLLDVLGYSSLDEIPEEALRDVLEYHVVSTALPSSNLSNGQTAATLNGESVTVNINGSTVMINMSTVVTADIEATNGVIHIIDAVLVPSSIETRTIAGIAGDTEILSTLVEAVSKYPDILAALNDPSETFTVFAPTNDAFASLLDVLGYGALADVPEDLLMEVLQYHVIAGSALQSGDLSDGQEAGTLLEGESITVTIDGTTVLINTSTVVMANVGATNGVVHVIDEVLVPSYVATSDIVQIASGAENLTVLVDALTRFPDLVETLSDNSGEFTVFAPTDAAFVALLGVIGQTGLDDIPESVIRRILEYHVVPSVARSTDLSDGLEVGTVLTDESVTVSITGDAVMINSANVTTANVEAVNGVVHIVDAVLVPSLEASIVNTVVEPAYFNENFTTLTAAVTTAGLLETLINPNASFTVFAPTNDAFEAAGITSLDGLTAEDLEPILLYHVLDFEADEAAVGALGTGSAVPALGGNSYLSINNDGIFLNGTTQVTATDIQADNGVVHVINRTLMPAASNVVEIAVNASTATEGAEFGQLVAALTAVSENTQTDLIAALSGEGPFTVFAPTDAAFQALYDAIGDDNQDGSVDISDLVSAVGLETIATVLQYHVYGGRVFSTDIPNLLGSNASVSISPLAGGSWDLNSDLTITPTDAALSVGLDAAEIVDTDILGTNGVIHVIDQVILP